MPERCLPGYGGYKTSFPQPVTKFQRSLYGYDFNDTRPIQNNRPGSNVSSSSNIYYESNISILRRISIIIQLSTKVFP